MKKPNLILFKVFTTISADLVLHSGRVISPKFGISSQICKLFRRTIIPWNTKMVAVGALTVVLTKNDPFYGIQRYYYILTGFCVRLGFAAIVLFLIRTVILLFFVAEAYRLLLLNVFLSFYWLEMLSKYLHWIRKIKRSDHFQKWYVRCQLICKVWEHYLNSWMRLMFGTFFFVIILGNTIVLRYYAQVPPIEFWIFPFASVLTASCVYFTFPVITACLEECTVELRRRFVKAKGLRGKLGLAQRKQVAALRPISIKCGGNFVIKKKTQSTFYEAVIYRTVDAILL